MKIVDVHYKGLVADPVDTAETVYGAFGLDLSAEARSAMTHWLAERNRHGQAQSGVKHSYSLEDFGLSEDMVEEAFGGYLNRYDIERERR